MMAYSMSPYEDLEWLRRELQKPLDAERRRRLEDAEHRAIATVERLEREGGLVCDACELGPGECSCVAVEDIRAVNGGSW